MPPTKEETTEETQTEETTETEQTPEQIAAEKKAAEDRAAALEEENARLKAEAERKTQPKNMSGYTLSSFTEAEWAEAEQTYGVDRKTILNNLNLKVQTEGRINSAVGRLESKLAVQQEKESLAAEDPLYPKYRKEVDKFLADVPEDFLLTAEGRKKWIGKAFEFAKRTVKAPPARKADEMGTRETNTPKEKNEEGFSVEEKSVFESHGKTPEDYKKLQHPFLKDGIMIKDRPEEPKFGAK